jgi:hypothetical protein
MQVGVGRFGAHHKIGSAPQDAKRTKAHQKIRKAVIIRRPQTSALVIWVTILFTFKETPNISEHERPQVQEHPIVVWRKQRARAKLTSMTG